MDLAPFKLINLCGHKDLEACNISEFKDIPLEKVADDILTALCKKLKYDEVAHESGFPVVDAP